MALQVYLNFNGNCREAVGFYQEVFQTEEPQIMTFAEMPPDPEYPIPDDLAQLVMHTSLEICGDVVMFSDTWPGSPLTVGNNFSLTISLEEERDIKRLYEALKEGGRIEMELQETFWSKMYGSVVDRFGITWQLNLDENE